MALLYGKYRKDDVTISVLGNDAIGYKYHWLDNSDSIKDESNTEMVLICDFSWSMTNSNSARPLLESIKAVCNLVLNDQNKLTIVFFGQTAHLISVKKNNYLTEIDKCMYGYFNSGWNNTFEQTGIFKPCGTCPEVAFELFCKHMLKRDNKNKNYLTVFMTDGEFTQVNKHISYETIWQKISSEFAKSGAKFHVHTIGYQNDHLQNIKDMKSGFDSNCIPFEYTTIANHSEIQKTMLNIATTGEENFVPSIYLDLNKKIGFQQYDTAYHATKYFDQLESDDLPKLIEQNMKNTGVSEDWILDVIRTEIQLGIKTDYYNKIMTSTSGDKKQLTGAVSNMVSDYTNIQHEYFGLKSKYKSLKTRHISVWKSYMEQIQDFTSCFREMQSMVKEDLNDKKAFERMTKMQVNSKHQQTLQRRRIQNEKNFMNKKEFDIIVQSEDPLILTDNISNKQSLVTGSIEQLNETITCFYTQDGWSELLNTLVGIPVKYVWKEQDDWSPSRAYIELVSTACFMSLDGFSEMQRLFGDDNHKVLYNEAEFIRSAHDNTNAIIPVATDPYFLSKMQLTKEHLGHMIAGSNFNFANRHVHLYTAVIRQCLYQLIANNTEKMEYVLMLLMNTYRQIITSTKCVYDINQKPLSLTEIIYQISLGNTMASYFSGSWEPLMFALVAPNTEYNLAYDKYKAELGVNININLESVDEYKQIVLKMALRNILINMQIELDSWIKPETWNMNSVETVKLELGTAKNTEDVIKIIEKHFMDTQKLDTLPVAISEQLEKTTKSNPIKVFSKIVEMCDKVNDDTWNKFNCSFLPMPFDQMQSNGKLAGYFSQEIISRIILETGYECIAYGTKDCFPYRNYQTVSKLIADRINSQYKSQFSETVSDAYELINFNKRSYEIRTLPVALTDEQTIKLNDLFDGVYGKTIGFEQFRTDMRNTLEEFTCYLIDLSLKTDNVDVIKNLYEHCGKHQNKLTIKPTRLPYSAPANPTSPYFLQVMSEGDFGKYYREVGLGWNTKKYINWDKDLHAVMLSLIDLPVNKFVNLVMEHIKNCITLTSVDDEHYTQYMVYFHTKFHGIIKSQPFVEPTNNNFYSK